MNSIVCTYSIIQLESINISLQADLRFGYPSPSVSPFGKKGSDLVLSGVQNMTKHLPLLLAGVPLIMVPPSTIWCNFL